MGRGACLTCAALVLLLVLQCPTHVAARKLSEPGAQTAAGAAPPSSADVSADIFRGAPAPPGVFDFMVRMKAYTRDEATGETVAQHMCGGALINANTVLTAAHCVVLKDGSMIPSEALLLEVRGAPYSAAAIYAHPAYSHASLEAQNADFSDGRVDSPLEPLHDIAVIKLATSVPDAPLVQLPAADLQLMAGQPVEVAGWGKMGDGEELPASETLLYANLELAAPFDFSNQGAPGTCPLPSFTDTLCAVNTADGANACAGDSGGPLLLRDFITGTATIVGVVSHGPPCSEEAHGFYTDVRDYLTDIDGWMAL